MKRIVCSILICPNADEEITASKTVATSRTVADKWMQAELTRINATSEHYCVAYATEYEPDDIFGDGVAVAEGRLAVGDETVEWWQRK